MKADFKKRLRELISRVDSIRDEIENLRSDHEEWMDEHDDNWQYGAAGERASEEQDSLQDFVDSLDSAIYDAKSDFNMDE